MPESDLVSPSQLPSSHLLHPGDHPQNLNYGNNNHNPQTPNNTQYFNTTNNINNDGGQFMNRSMNEHPHQSQAGTPHIPPNHSLLNSSNDQNNNSNNANEIQGPPRNLPPERRDLFEELRNGGGHWSQLLRQVILHLPSDADLPPDDKLDDPESHIIPIEVDGGSENGQFVYVGQVNSDINSWIAVGYLQSGDLILDIHGQQVAGYTQADVLSLLHHCLRGNSVTLTVAPRGSLGPELRSYLNTRFQKGSVDHALQGVVRDNLYLRTVPVTTRQPRPGEINGVDYTFLSPEEFMELERNGSLLESGVYAGNHYGTPKPWASQPRNVNSGGGVPEGGQGNSESAKGTMLPGMHPSSEGKRRRNRSNVQALGAGDDDEPSSSNVNSPSHNSSVPVTYSPRYQPPDDELGPLPSNWEMAYTEKGEVYFIDHNTGTSHWLDPRLSRVQKMTLEDCEDNELPFGWERIDDPHYGTYYIDHVNRRTQFENPVLQAKQQSKTSLPGSPNEPPELTTMRAHIGPPKNPFPPRYSSANPPPPNPKPVNPNRLSVPRGKTPVDLPPDQLTNDSHSALPHVNYSAMPNNMTNSNGLRVKGAERPSQRFFTRDPSQLIGERISTSLMKSSRGLGFTIVGGDDDDGLDEFLQIKSVVADGPAWRDGKLRTGDVLVRVNGRNVLGYTHQEMVSIFQSIAPGEDVHLEVCRGYPLPFDPADPNTEIVTTVAVAPFNPVDNGEKRQLDWMGRPSTPDSLAHSAHSLPELSGDRIGYGKSTTGRPASVDLLLDSPTQRRSEKTFSSKLPPIETGTFLTVAIIKGTAGFGFTIADSVTGQKVKKVLDPTHCGGLEEGDRLIAIDGIDLRGLSHTQVVQILKDFPLGRDASLTIQRIHTQQSFSQKFSPIPSSNYTDSQMPTNRPGMSPRSKTPTAEVGRGRPRLRDSLPDRPKTPVFDNNGQYNGHGGIYNGDVSFHQQGQLPLENSHGFAPPDRFAMSPGAPMNHNSENPEMNHGPISRDWVETTIELQRRQEGFGFRIVGGTEEGSQVSVGHIVPRGAAALDGRLQTNDQLIAVDGVSVIGASHHSVVQLMARAASAHRVRLTIRRPVYSNNNPPASEGVGSPSHSPAISVPLNVTLKRQPTEGFGFVIISSASKAGATIGRIVEGSPADKCTQLHVGDRILAVNQTEISQLHHSQVVQLIKDSGLLLTLTVLPVSNSDNPLQNQPQLSPSNPANMITSDLENLGLKDSHGYDIGTAFIHPVSQPIHFASNSIGSSYTESVEQVFSVQLSRGARGFGFSIRGGKEFQNMPLFVLRLAEDGPATMDGRMQVGDQILQINGINTQGMTHSQAIHLIKTGGASVHLLLRRGAVPTPYLNQIPNFPPSGGFAGMNGHEEEQSVSSNNDPQFVGQTSPVYRDHAHKSSYPPQM